MWPFRHPDRYHRLYGCLCPGGAGDRQYRRVCHRRLSHGWVARPALGILLDKKGPIATLIPAGLFFSAGLLCLAFAQDLTWFIISGILIGIGQNGISPVLMTISMRTVPAERKAAANSTNYLGMDIGSDWPPRWAACCALCSVTVWALPPLSSLWSWPLPGCGNFVQIGKAGKDCLTVSLPHISVRAVV